LRDLSPGQPLLDTRDERGRGIAITTSNRFSLRLTLNGGQRESAWERTGARCASTHGNMSPSSSTAGSTMAAPCVTTAGAASTRRWPASTAGPP
jgi:hypothetical protein